MTIVEATTRLQAIIQHIEEPNVSTPAGTTSLSHYTGVLLNGHSSPPTGGLLEAEQTLLQGQVGEFCAEAAGILRNSLINRLMGASGRDAVEFTASDAEQHDPAHLFLNDDRSVVLIMESPVRVPRERFGLYGDVASRLWREDALALMDIIYGLGQDCIDAAREDSS